MAQLPLTENSLVPEKYVCMDTDSSLNPLETNKIQEISSTKLSKKRIGPYAYKLEDSIGSGFSSTVYKGYKENDKTQVVAIKVICLTNMKPHRRQLLDDEIKILKKVNHPNLLTFKDLYLTANNCYIISQYCEGGSLQQSLTGNSTFDWRRAAYEVSLACQYLATMNIIHRDIKPTNVLIHNGCHILCDFGFSCQLSGNQSITENYLIGSPLYMPPQSLSQRLYSSKSDSFAFGVLLYYMMSKRFPWKGRNKEQLIQAYKKKKMNKQYISHLPPRVKHLISGLLQIDTTKRLHLSDCDFSMFLHLGPPVLLTDKFIFLKECYTEQLQLCQYTHSLLLNYLYFSWANSYLQTFIQRHLNSLTFAFEWHNHSAMYSVRKNYCLSPDNPQFHSDDYYWLNNCLKDTISVLSIQLDNFSLVMLQKLLPYQQIIQAFLFESPQELFQRIKELVLHANFQSIRPNQIKIKNMLNKLDFYEL